MKLTNTRTFLQFSKGEKVFTIIYNGNKLMAMFAIRSVYGVKYFSTLREYKTDGYLPEGYYTEQ